MKLAKSALHSYATFTPLALYMSSLNVRIYGACVCCSIIEYCTHTHGMINSSDAIKCERAAANQWLKNCSKIATLPSVTIFCSFDSCKVSDPIEVASAGSKRGKI